MTGMVLFPYFFAQEIKSLLSFRVGVRTRTREPSTWLRARQVYRAGPQKTNTFQHDKHNPA